MNHPQDAFETWKADRRGGGAPDGFADRVMSRVRAELGEDATGGRRSRPGRVASLRWPTWHTSSVLALAAGVLFVVACHAAVMGTVLLALAETAS